MVAARMNVAIQGDVDLADIVISDRYQEIKHRAFNLLLERLQTRRVSAEQMSHQALRLEIVRTLGEVEANLPIPLNSMERERLIEDVVSESVGLGPLEPLLSDPTVDDIIVNGPHALFVERAGR